MLSQNPISPVNRDVEAETLHTLILFAQRGNAQAFGQVYTALYVPLYRYVMSRCHTKELTEDICQQAFLKFYAALPTYIPEKPPLAYLFTIAKHLLINHHEKRAFDPVDEAFFETHDDKTPSLVDEAHVKHLAERVNTYLPLLTDDEQDVIRLFFYAEREYKEIAEILSKDEATLRKIKERALKKLRTLTTHLHASI